MNESIVKFMEKQTVATICCIDEQGDPYCFSCFYAFNSESGLLYYKSSSNAQHSLLLKRKGIIAGTILPDRLRPLLVQGIQFEGIILPSEAELCNGASKRYLMKFPFALAMPGDVYAIQLAHIKMTDSTKGFGKKILWNRKTDEVHQTAEVKAAAV
jgi:uncharacterized protein